MRSLLPVRSIFVVTALGAAFLARPNAVLSGLTGGNPTYAASEFTIGWRFTTTQPLSITALGFNDVFTTDNLIGTHQVGIWDVSSGALMTSTTVLVNDRLNSGFRYHNLAAPYILAPGTYNLGARVGPSANDSYRVGSTFTTLPVITYVGSLISDPGTGFSNPTTLDGSVGRFGPNMFIQPDPEPSTFLVLGLPALALLGRRRRT